jgi:hypothetical protein
MLPMRRVFLVIGGLLSILIGAAVSYGLLWLLMSLTTK